MKTLASLLALVALSACSGRPHLDEDFARNQRAVFRAQAEAHPSKAATALNAADARLIVKNMHRACGNDSGSGGGDNTASGMMVPILSALGAPAPAGDNNNGISLDAK